jgi:hypothetical protein
MGKHGSLLIACLALSLPTPAVASSCTANSGPTLTPLIELYTSEGCSSCPPADRWLAGLPPGRAVPLALHVDYWGYIGWRDRYADARFAARQREVVRRGGGRVVYTPQVLLDGRDFRGWRDDTAFGQALARIAAKPAQARIVLNAARKQADVWSIRLEGQAAPRKGRAAAYLAIYENGLASDVGSGENAGARLLHGYVVRDWSGPIAADADGRMALSRDLARKDIEFSNAGMAAFIEDPDTGEILQALTLPFCRN